MTVMPDCFGLSARDVVMPVVPLFHANCWSLAFAAPMAGAGLVMPGPKLDGASVYDILDERARDLHGGRADDLVRAAPAPGEGPAARCRTSRASRSAARPARPP